MPNSKSRHPHKHSQHHPHAQTKPVEIQARPKNENRVVTIAVLFFAVLGLAVGFFIDPTNVLVIVGSTFVGAITGYFAGQQIKKSFTAKS